MNAEHDWFAWGVYLLGVMGLLSILWYLTSWLSSKQLASLLRLSGLVFLVLPYPIGEGYAELAPAWLMFLMEAVFEGEVARTGVPLLSAWLISLLLALGWSTWTSMQARKRAEAKSLNRQREELLDQSYKAP